MIDDLMFSLKIARQSLPNDTHPIHAARLYLIEQIVKRALEAEPDHWRDALASVEQLSVETNPRQPKGGQMPHG
jgi:hypothetical protein